MLCRHYMVRSAAARSAILDTATLGEALARMTKHHMQQLLVANAEGTYLGEINTFTLTRLLLPAGTEKQTQEEANFETVADVDERIMPHLGRKVSDFIEHEIPTVHPDTPLTEIVQMFVKGKLRLPVVEPGTNKLIGVISPLTVLRRYQF